MIREPHKGYMAPWSSRRETAGLVGTFLIFLMSFPAHSGSLAHEAWRLVQQSLHFPLLLLSLFSAALQPLTPQGTWIPSRFTLRKITRPHTPAVTPIPVVARKTPVTVDENSMILRLDPGMKRFTYIFNGIATEQGKPYANAVVLVRLMSGEKTVTKRTTTTADGSYSLSVAIDAEYNAPLDWSMEAYTPDFNKVEMAGRKIIQRQADLDDEPIVVNTPVEFILSSAK